MSDIFAPKDAVNDDFLRVVELFVKSGDFVEEGAKLLLLEGSKTIIEITSQSSGYVALFCSLSDEVAVGALLASIDSEKKEGVKRVEKDATHTLFSDAALKLIGERNIDVSVYDGLSFVDSKSVLEKSRNKIPDTKKKEIEILSQNGSLNSVVSVLVDADGLFRYTKRNHEIFKFSLSPLIIKEVSHLLKKYKKLNAYFDKDEIIYYDAVHIGYAIDGEHGLKVATLFDADKKESLEIENSLSGLIQNYKANRLTPKELSGATATITDMSFLGVSFFMPLLPKWQSAIFGISSVHKKTNDFFISCSFDHRVSEGKYVANFLGELRENIEKYAKG